MRRLIYICSPYQGNPKGNSKQLRAYCRSVYECGYIPLAPFLHYPQFLSSDIPKERRDCLLMAQELLRRCNSVVVCGSKLTEDMQAEIQLAKQLGMVITTLDGFLTAQRMKRENSTEQEAAYASQSLYAIAMSLYAIILSTKRKRGGRYAHESVSRAILRHAAHQSGFIGQRREVPARVDERQHRPAPTPNRRGAVRQPVAVSGRRNTGR